MHRGRCGRGRRRNCASRCTPEGSRSCFACCSPRTDPAGRRCSGRRMRAVVRPWSAATDSRSAEPAIREVEKQSIGDRPWRRRIVDVRPIGETTDEQIEVAVTVDIAPRGSVGHHPAKRPASPASSVMSTNSMSGALPRLERPRRHSMHNAMRVRVDGLGSS